MPQLWLAGALGLLLSLGGAFWAGDSHGHKAERVVWEATQARERADAAQVQAAAEKRAREAENTAAEAARTIEEQHAKDQAGTRAARHHSR